MEFELGLTLEESGFIRNALDVVQIQGKNAKLVANLQDKFEEHIFQIQANMQMEQQSKTQQLEEIINSPTNRGRKPKQ
jgi:hypothetical protein